MKPHHKLAETKTPDGIPLTLEEHDGSFCIRINGLALMHSRATTSELHLGELAVGRLSAVRRPRVLIGGLGLGFTLRRVLESAGAEARVEVAELMPEVVEWNRTHMADLNGHLLEDRRVRVRVGDVWEIIGEAAASVPEGAEDRRYDAILIDIDNGPQDMVQKSNLRLYTNRGIAIMAAALRPGGRVAIWSAGADTAFAHRLARAKLQVEVVRAKPNAASRSRTYAIFVADKAGAGPKAPTTGQGPGSGGKRVNRGGGNARRSGRAR
jgi:spermidine synthase